MAKKFNRRSIRLRDYDYSRAGVYFVTICVFNKENVFGEIKEEKMILNKLGEKVKEFWEAIPDHSENVFLDEFVVMPNHIHGLIIITDDCRGVLKNAPDEGKNDEGVQSNARTENTLTAHFSKISPSKNTLSVVVRTFKSAFTAWCRKNGYADFKWLRNYYERVIRNEKEFYSVQKYIYYNPVKWAWDEENQI